MIGQGHQVYWPCGLWLEELRQCWGFRSRRKTWSPLKRIINEKTNFFRSFQWLRSIMTRQLNNLQKWGTDGRGWNPAHRPLWLPNAPTPQTPDSLHYFPSLRPSPSLSTRRRSNVSAFLTSEWKQEAVATAAFWAGRRPLGGWALGGTPSACRSASKWR